jgi:toxin ParE1/3/4
MQVRWSPAAAEDFFRIIEFIRRENPVAAQRVAKTIYEIAGSLASFPNKGKSGRVEGTRELPLPRLPFVVVYRVVSSSGFVSTNPETPEIIVEIANVIHGAQKWPPKD